VSSRIEIYRVKNRFNKKRR